MLWLIRHAMCALYPRTDELPGIADTGIDAFLAQYKRESTTLIWIGVCAGTLAFVLSPIFSVYLPLPSFLLPASLLEKHAGRVVYSRIYLLRQAVFLVKLAAGMCWGRHPDVRAKMAMAPYPADPDEWRTS